MPAFKLFRCPINVGEILLQDPQIILGALTREEVEAVHEEALESFHIREAFTAVVIKFEYLSGLGVCCDCVHENSAQAQSPKQPDNLFDVEACKPIPEELFRL